MKVLLDDDVFVVILVSETQLGIHLKQNPFIEISANTGSDSVNLVIQSFNTAGNHITTEARPNGPALVIERHRT